MPMSRLFAGTSVTSCRPTRTCPESTSSRPASARSAVVLPQPDGPSSATSSPGSMSSDSPSSAFTGPNQRCRSTRRDGDAARRSRGSALLAVMRRASSTSGGAPTDGAGGRSGRSRAAARTRTAAPPARRHRTSASRLPIRTIDDLQGLEGEQRRDRVLAEHHRDRDDRGRQDAAADVGDDDPQDRSRPAGAEAAGCVRERRDVDRAKAESIAR